MRNKERVVALALSLVVLTIVLIGIYTAQPGASSAVSKGSSVPEVAKSAQTHGPRHAAAAMPQQQGSERPAVDTPAEIPDRDAASNRFQEAKRCLSVWEAIDNDQSQIRVLQNFPAHASDRDANLKRLAQLEAHLHDLLPQFDGCRSDGEVLSENYYQATTQAARLGDTFAQLCWVEGYWHHELSNEDYQREALGYLNAALARGDWRFVALMAKTYVDNAPRSAGLLVYAEKSDDHQVSMSDFYAATYRMHRLLSLGAQGEYQKWIQGTGSSNPPISPEQKAAADAWADSQYLEHFANQPGPTEVPDSCSMSMNQCVKEWIKHPWQTHDCQF